MTRNSIREYAKAARWRYLRAEKKAKGIILDEFCKTTGYHRKAAIRLLCNPAPASPSARGRGRPSKYQPALLQPLKMLWEISDRLCSKRLKPFLPELVGALERHGEIQLEPEVKQRLLEMSEATIDRYLKPLRSRGLRRPYSQSRSSSTLKALIPIRTFSDWAGVKPGSAQADLVMHCGESLAGFHLTTLLAVDVATSWTECEAIWGKGQQWVGAGMHHARQRMPFTLKELHTDNGGEFLNQVLYRWCKREGIHFTRGRAYKKNDQAYAEQKNWSTVRRVVGYDRYSSRKALAQLQKVYSLLRLHVNFFQPVRKLIGKERVGAKVRKRYDTARTPYQRLLAFGVLGEAKRRDLERLFNSVNPVQLRAQIDAALDDLWKLADHPASTSTSKQSPKVEVYR